MVHSAQYREGKICFRCRAGRDKSGSQEAEGGGGVVKIPDPWAPRIARVVVLDRPLG